VFEAWKARPEAAPLLAKDFVNLYVDAGKIPGGKELHAAYPKSQSSGIPWFVILDADGKELADSGEGGRNIGCPDTDPEIDAWIAILKKVRLTLTDDDLETLKRSRVAHREERKRK
jgi:hypothetical protein